MEGKNICVLFMDLSMAFDKINYDLLLAIRIGFQLTH